MKVLDRDAGHDGPLNHLGKQSGQWIHRAHLLAIQLVSRKLVVALRCALLGASVMIALLSDVLSFTRPKFVFASCVRKKHPESSHIVGIGNYGARGRRQNLCPLKSPALPRCRTDVFSEDKSVRKEVLGHVERSNCVSENPQ
jgi:hypothetical protein